MHITNERTRITHTIRIVLINLGRSGRGQVLKYSRMNVHIIIRHIVGNFGSPNCYILWDLGVQLVLTFHFMLIKNCL